MHISRRQLEHAGLPLEGMTRRKVGGRIFGDGGGGGGGPQQQTVNQSNIPEYARPYVEDTLARAQALTTNTPYMQYQGQRVAGPSSLQQAAYSQAGGLGPSSYLGQAATQANSVASRAASVGNYTPGQFAAQGPMMTGTGQWGQGAADAYMNPYMQSVVDVQKREAMRASDIAGQKENAGAVGAGAFGGTRHALVQAERERNLMTQLNDIQAQGSNAAWGQAQQQFNTDQGRSLASQQSNQGAWGQYAALDMDAQRMREASRQFGSTQGLQALNTQLQAGSLLGNLGGQQFQQSRDAIALRAGLGQQQQAQQQQVLDNNYQDWLNWAQHPYKQLEFMSGALRGLPLSQTTSTMYGGQPSALQTAGSLALGAYGLSRMKEGGKVESFAGGGSVTDERNVESILDNLSDQQLAQAKRAALARRDPAQAQLIDKELAERASMRRGIAGGLDMDAVNNLMPTMPMARGGVVAAYAGGGDVDDEDGYEYPKLDLSNILATSYYPGSPDTYQQALNQALGIQEALGKYRPKAMSPEDYTAAVDERKKALTADAGESPVKGFLERLAKERGESAKELEKGKGLAALAAAGAMLQGSGFAQGLGRAATTFAGEAGRAASAHRADRRALDNAEFQALGADRREKMGLTKEAIAHADAMRRAAQDGDKNAIAALSKAGEGYARIAQAAKPQLPGAGRPASAGAGAGKPPKPPPWQYLLMQAEEAYAADPSEANLKTLNARRAAADRLRDKGPGALGVDSNRVDVTVQQQIAAAVDKRLENNMAYFRAQTIAGNPKKSTEERAQATALMQQLRQQALAEEMAVRQSAGPGVTQPAPGSNVPRVPVPGAPGARPGVNKNPAQAQQKDYSSLFQ